MRGEECREREAGGREDEGRKRRKGYSAMEGGREGQEDGEGGREGVVKCKREKREG